MNALVWHGKEDIRYVTVSDPAIEHPCDAIIKVTSCAICGSDLHFFHNLVPAMLPGDIMGHEFMGEVVEVGSAAKCALVWRGRPKLFGRQAIAATRVDFADQVGVYLLHDRDRMIYVGRATDSLVVRLMAHTIDRLGGRWDRFSWFGLRNVGPDGQLIHTTVPWDERVVIETLEALLIESLEPPLNAAVATTSPASNTSRRPIRRSSAWSSAELSISRSALSMRS